MHEGEPGASLFLVLEGEVSVRRHDAAGAEQEIYLQGPGEIVGHMSAMTGAPRFATVRAREAAALAEIDATSLAPLISAHPELVEHVAREILRLEAADQRLRAQGEPMGMMEEPHLLARLADRIRLFFGDAATPQVKPRGP